MSFSSLFAKVVALIGGGALAVAQDAGRAARAGLGQRAGDSGGEAARRDPDA